MVLKEKIKNSIAKFKNLLNGSLRIKKSKINYKVSFDKNILVENSTIIGRVSLKSGVIVKNSILIGDMQLLENSKIKGATLYGNISIGTNSSLWGPNLDIYSGHEKVVIGNFCSIARNVSMQTYNHNPKKITSYYIGQNIFKEKWKNEYVSKGNIIIKNDVWIATHCVLLGGITINNGAIVAANSVVNKDVPAYSIVAGNPAKVIGYRFNEETISKLQKMAWWNWSVDKIKQSKSLFESLNFENKI